MNIELTNEEASIIYNALNDRRNTLDDDLKNIKSSPDLQWLVREFTRQLEVIDDLLENKIL